MEESELWVTYYYITLRKKTTIDLVIMIFYYTYLNLQAFYLLSILFIKKKENSHGILKLNLKHCF